MPYNNTPIAPSKEITGTVSLPRMSPYALSLLSFYTLFVQQTSKQHQKSIINASLVARVKKIISQDDDISNCSNNAAFVITVATEMFLQHLVEQSHNVVKSERKPRRNIQYRDVGAFILSLVPPAPLIYF